MRKPILKPIIISIDFDGNAFSAFAPPLMPKAPIIATRKPLSVYPSVFVILFTHSSLNFVTPSQHNPVCYDIKINLPKLLHIQVRI